MMSHVLLIVTLSAIPWFTPKMAAGQLLFCSFAVVYDVIGAWEADFNRKNVSGGLKPRPTLCLHSGSPSTS